MSRPRIVAKGPVTETAAPLIDTTAAAGGRAINIVGSTRCSQHQLARIGRSFSLRTAMGGMSWNHYRPSSRLGFRAMTFLRYRSDRERVVPPRPMGSDRPARCWAAGRNARAIRFRCSFHRRCLRFLNFSQSGEPLRFLAHPGSWCVDVRTIVNFVMAVTVSGAGTCSRSYDGSRGSETGNETSPSLSIEDLRARSASGPISFPGDKLHAIRIARAAGKRPCATWVQTFQHRSTINGATFSRH